MKTIKLKINKDIPGYSAGRTIDVQTDDHGTPFIKFWRDRLRDAEHDSCVEIVKTKPKSKKSSQETE